MAEPPRMPLSDEAPADQAERELAKPKAPAPGDVPPADEDAPRDRDREPPPAREEE